MKIAVFFSFFLFILIGACNFNNNKAENEKEEAQNNRALTQIKSTYDAQGVDLMFKRYIGEDTSNRIEITISKVGEKYRKANSIFITSTSALTFFQSLTGEEIKTYRKIKVIVDRDSEKMSNIYSMEQLARVETDVNSITNFFYFHKSKKFDSVRELVDSAKISDSDLVGTLHVISQIDSAYGQTSNLPPFGFVFGTSEPLTLIWIRAQNGDASTFYSFQFDDKSMKMTSIGINSQKIKGTALYKLFSGDSTK